MNPTATPPSLLTILSFVPLWVWAILALILVLGTLQTRPQLMKPRRLVILPAVWLVYGAWGVQASFGLSAAAVLAWLAGLALSVLAMRRSGWPGQARFVPELARYRVPGSWWPLALMLSLFAAKFALGMSLALQPNLARELSVALGFSVVFGLLSGALLGRSLNILAGSRA